jgi:N4-gp56 family major capsid protein
MAKTNFTTSNALTKKAWEEKLFRDVNKESYFSRFMGDGSDSVVCVKRQLEKEQGDKITFGLRMRLTGAGVTSGTTLEGNEERLTTHDYSLSLEQYRHGVRDDGAMTRQRAMFSISKESETAIRDWGAEKIDTLCFDALKATPTRVAYLTNTGIANYAKTGTAATAKAALTASSLLEPYFISYVKTLAKTGFNRDTIPLRPVKVKGKEYFILLVHPDVMFNLKTNSTFQQALREAQVRGNENPIFKGATAIWDGVVVHEHENVAIGTDAGGSSVPWAECTLMGAQSLVWAWGKRPRVISAKFDYENEMGYGFDMICATGKPKFNSEDYGSIGVYVARTQVSDS